MASYMTTDDLINSVKRRASIPEAQSTFSEQDFIDFINEEMDLGMVPLIMSTHEEYFIQTQETQLVANQDEYRIPERAIVGKLRDVHIKDLNNNHFEMTRISLENIFDNQYNNVVNNRFDKFYVKGNKIVMYPSITQVNSESVVMTYFRRPNELVSSARTGTITAIDTGTGKITLNKIPSNFSSTIQYDFVQTKSPHEIYSMDNDSTAIDTANKTITFAVEDLPSDLAVGDYVMQATETFVPNIPTELHTMLAHRAAARCLESMGDNNGLAAANLKLKEMEEKSTNMIENRVVGAPLKVINKTGFLRKNFRR
jgi:hypothetical protein